MKRFAPLGLAAVLAFGPFANGPAFAQQASAPAPAAEDHARASDVASIDGIIAALYDVISGPAGKPRDWNRMRSLFAPDARMMAVGAKPDGSISSRSTSVEDYITRNAPHFASNGFFEREAARTSDVFGQVAHVFSTYEARHATADATPFARGINSIQLVNDGKRWWIVNLVWRAEDASLRLPERYLQSR